MIQPKKIDIIGLRLSVINIHHETDTLDGQPTCRDRKENKSFISFQIKMLFLSHSHEKLHKSNVLIQPFNRLHLLIREAEVKYLQLEKMGNKLLFLLYFLCLFS